MVLMANGGIELNLHELTRHGKSTTFTVVDADT